MPNASTEIAIISATIAFTSMCVTVWLWQRTNRPILSARVTAVAGGNEGIALNILVENTGNRPAKEISIKADEHRVLNALVDSSNGDAPTDARRCLLEERMIPVIANGRTVSNAFGHLGNNPGAWQSGAVIPVVIRYRSLEGQRYTGKMNLLLADDAGFAQTFWSEP
ncbi:TPA: hypothetical protein ONA18_004148 [Pseudomonas aeruginosa]|nr:hypothetical protein [Pseudomonas aeruginosa]